MRKRKRKKWKPLTNAELLQMAFENGYVATGSSVEVTVIIAIQN